MKTSWIALIVALTIGFVSAQRSLDLSKPIINLGKRSQPTTWQRPPEERRKLSIFPKTNMKFVVTPKPVVKDESAASGLPTKKPLMRKLIIRDSNDKGSWYFPPREPLMKSKRFTVAADSKLNFQQDTMPKLNIRPTFVPKKPKTLSELKKEHELNKVVLNKGNLMSVVQNYASSEKILNEDGINNKVNINVSSNQQLNKNYSASNEDSSDKMYDYESETTTDLYDDEVTTTTKATTTERDNEPEVSTILPLDYKEPLDAVIEGRSDDFDETELTNQIDDILLSKYVQSSVNKPKDKNLNTFGTLIADNVNNTKIFTAQTPQPVPDTQHELLDSKDKTNTNNSQKIIENNASEFSKNPILSMLHSDTTESLTLASVLHDSFKTEVPIRVASDDFDPISTKNIHLEVNTFNTLYSQNYLTEKSTTSTVSEIYEDKNVSELTYVILAEGATEKSDNLSRKYFSGIELILDQNIHLDKKQSENSYAFSDKPVIDKENKDIAEETNSIESNLAYKIMSVESLTEDQSIEIIDDVTTEPIIDVTSDILPNNDQLVILKLNNLTNEDISHESIIAAEKFLHESIENPFNGLKDDIFLRLLIDKSSSTLSDELTSMELLTDILNIETNETPSNVSNLTGENMSNDSMPAQYFGISDHMSIDPSIDSNRSILAGKLVSDELTINNLNGKETSFKLDEVSVKISNETLMNQSKGSEMTTIEPELSSTLAEKQVYNDSISDIINNLTGEVISNDSNVNVDNVTNNYNVTIETTSIEVEVNESADLNNGFSSQISSDEITSTSNQLMADTPDKQTGEELSNESNLTDEDIPNNSMPAQTTGISGEISIDSTIDNTSSILPGKLMSDELTINNLNGKETSFKLDEVSVKISNETLMNQSKGSEMTTIEPELSSTLAEKQVYNDSISDIINNLTGEVISNDPNVNVDNVTNNYNVTIETTSIEVEVNESADLNNGFSSQISSDEITSTSNQLMADTPDKQTGEELSNESNLTDEDIPNNSMPAQTTGISGEISIDPTIDNTSSILPGKLMSDELTVDKINNFNGKKTTFESDEVSVEISNESLMGQSNGSEITSIEPELSSTLAEKQVYNDSILVIKNKLTGEEISNGSSINVDDVTNDYNVTNETTSIEAEENKYDDLNDGISSHISSHEITSNELIADIPDKQTGEELSNLTDEDIPNNSMPAQNTGVSDEISIDPPIDNASSILSGELISDELIINKLNDLSAKETSYESDVVGIEILNEYLMDHSASGEITSIEPVSDELSSSADKQVDNESILDISNDLISEEISNDFNIADERISNDSNVTSESKSTEEKGNESFNLNDGISIQPSSDADSTNIDSEQLSDEQMTEISNNFIGEEMSDESNFAREEISNKSNQSADISLDGAFINTSTSQQVSDEPSVEPITFASELILEEVYNDSFADSQNIRSEENIDGVLIKRFKRGNNIIEEENIGTTLSAFKYTGHESRLTHVLSFKNINA